MMRRSDKRVELKSVEVTDDRRAFYVVQFIELPFEGIDGYVCVPSTWANKAMRTATNQMYAVAYPREEDPFVTRDRVRSKERYNDEWKFYMAAVKNETNSYQDAENWIATRNDYGPLVKEELERTETEPNKQLTGKQIKLDDAAQSSRAVVSYANASSEESAITHTGTTASDSNGRSSSFQQKDESLQASLPIQEQQELSIPSIDVDTPTFVIDDDEEVQPASIEEQQVPSYQAISQFTQDKQRQSQPSHQDSQRQPKKPKIRIGKSTKPKTNQQTPTLQVTKETLGPILTKLINSLRKQLSTTNNQYLQNEQQFQGNHSERAHVNENHPNVSWRFVLPPEYDPRDNRWTLKYRTKLPGLVELTYSEPNIFSDVFVSYEDLKYCQLVSKDCKSLAQRLLLAVFNRNALSVCLSMTERAQLDSDNVGSTIRPELDPHACSVLLNFVLEHGLKHGWNTDLKPILSTTHGKIQEIRFKYGVMVQN